MDDNKNLLERLDNVIVESSLSRIVSHLKGDTDRPVGFISAERGRYTKAENNSRSRKLAVDIKNAGYGFLKVSGRYIEGYGTAEATPVSETTFMVIGNESDKVQLLKFLAKEGDVYNQDSILYIVDGEAKLIGTSERDEEGNKIEFPGKGKTVKLGNFHPQKTGEFFTQWKGKTWTFESCENEPNIMGRMARKLMNESMGTVMMWITPRGKMLVDTNGTHIQQVINNPALFGLTKDQIQKEYDSYGEKLNQEGKAREKIIVDLVKQGYIRLRRYTNKQWSVNVDRLNKRTKDYLTDWANKILTKGIGGFKENDKHMPVVLMVMHDNRVIQDYTVKEVAEFSLLDENEQILLYNVSLLT